MELFRKVISKKILLPLIITTIIAISGCAQKNSPQESTNSNSKALTASQKVDNQITLGHQVFNQNCADCHGINGDNAHLVDDQVVNSMVKTLAADQASLANFIQKNCPMNDDGSKMNSTDGMSQMNGNGSEMDMSGMSHTISQADSEAISAYIWSGEGETKKIDTFAVNLNNPSDQLFKQECNDCHGLNGDCMNLLNLNMNYLLKNLAGSPERLAGFIKAYAPMTDEGSKDPHGGNLTDAQSASITSYLWSLSK